MKTRLTRKEQQAATREALVESAIRVLASKGLHRASIDDITAEAGFTKGAFYANFTSKEELFLVMLDEHFAARVDSIERLTGDGRTIADQAETVGLDFLDALRGDRDWCRLFLELSSHATRHEDFRVEFNRRSDDVRRRVTEILEKRAAEAGIVPSVPAETIARMAFAMAHGAAIEQLLDEATPDELFGTMLRLFFTGVAVEAAGA